MNGEKVLHMLGLAKRAGYVKSGSFLSEKAIVSGRAKLFLAPEGNLSRTVQEVFDRAKRAGIPCIACGTKESIGKALGEAERSCAVITDEGFASAIRKIADQE